MYIYYTYPCIWFLDVINLFFWGRPYQFLLPNNASLRTLNASQLRNLRAGGSQRQLREFSNQKSAEPQMLGTSSLFNGYII